MAERARRTATVAYARWVVDLPISQRELARYQLAGEPDGEAAMLRAALMEIDNLCPEDLAKLVYQGRAELRTEAYLTIEAK